MSKSTFQKSALALAVAGSFIVPQAAFAAASALTDAGTALSLQAPFSTAFQAGYSKNVSFTVTRNGTAATSDNMRLVAFLYNSGTYVGTVKSAAMSGQTSFALTQTVNLPASAAGYNQATFALLYESNEAGAGNAADDTVDAAAANVRVLKIEPVAARTGAVGDLVPVDVSSITGGVYTTDGGATPAQLAEIGALAAMKANPTTMGTYTGPVLQSAQTAALLNGTDVKLTFDTSLKAIADNNASSIGGGLDINVAAAAVATAVTNGAVAAGDKVVRFDDASAAFAGLISSVDINFVADCSPANLISDEAGNCPVVAAATAVTAFAEPKFATTGTAQVLVTGGTGIVAADVDDLYTATGLTSAAAETLILTVRMDELFNGVGVDNVDDITLAGTTGWNAAISAAGANANTFTVTLTSAAGGQVLKIDSSGNLTNDGTAVTLGLAVGASALTTAETKALTAGVTAVNVKIGVAPAATTVTTADDNADGILDGVHLNLGAPATSPLGTSGAKLVDRDTVATEVASAVTVNSKDTTGSTLDVIATAQANIIALIGTGETQATNLGTAATNATPIPYDASLTSSSITYSFNYDVATGNLRTLPDIATGGAIGDGAAPVLLSVNRLTGDKEGKLDLVFSEAIAGTPKVKDVAVDGGALILVGKNTEDDDISDVAGGGTVGDGAIATTTIANDTASFFNVDNTNLTAMTTVGVTAGNTSLVGADTNVIAAQTVTAAAATADTTIAPTVKSVVAIENSAGFITTVLLNLSETTTAKGTPKASDFIVNLSGIAITPSTAAASGNILTLTLPGSGIRRDLVTADGTLDYTNSTSPTNGWQDADTNLMANFAGTALEVPMNSEELHIQEISAKLTTDGSTSVPKGTLVRAQLVEVYDNPSVTYNHGVISVPCNCDGKSINIALQDGTGWTWTDVEKDKYNKKTINAWIMSNSDTNNDDGTSAKYATLVSALPADAANDNLTYFKVQVDRKSGKITGQATGQVFYQKTSTGSVSVLDDTWQNVDDGNIRMSVGVTDKERGQLLGAKDRKAFVLVSVKKPGDTKATLISSPVETFSNHLPFVSELDSAGTITGALGTVDLSKIEAVMVENTNVWQLLGMSGDFSFKDTKNKQIDLGRFFLTIDNNGATVTRWLFDANEDMAFTLRDNRVDTAVEINNGSTSVTSSKIPTFNGGDGLAFDEGGAAAENTLWVPITGSTVSRTVKKGWTLMTSVAAIPEASFASNNIDAVVCTGGGDDSTSWFKGAVNNTLNTTAAGDACFVYFSAETKDFKFGK